MQKLLPFEIEVVDIFPSVNPMGDQVAMVTNPSFDKPLSNITMNIALCTMQPGVKEYKQWESPL